MKRSRKPKSDNRRSVQRMVPPRRPEPSYIATREMHSLAIGLQYSLGQALADAFKRGFKDGWAARGNDKGQR